MLSPAGKSLVVLFLIHLLGFDDRENALPVCMLNPCNSAVEVFVVDSLSNCVSVSFHSIITKHLFLPFHRAIQESPSHMCKTCRHLMLEHELDNGKWVHCPLCHSPLILSSLGK